MCFGREVRVSLLLLQSLRARKSEKERDYSDKSLLFLLLTVAHGQKTDCFFCASCQIIPSSDSATLPQPSFYPNVSLVVHVNIPLSSLMWSQALPEAPWPVISLWNLKLPNSSTCTGGEVGSSRWCCPCNQQEPGHCQCPLMVPSRALNWKSWGRNLSKV